jgi:hypothetical protein
VRRAALVGLLALTPGCLLSFPDPDEGAYACALDTDCAAGFVCQQAVCARPGGADAGSADAGQVDAGPPDAGQVDAGPGRDAGPEPDAGPGDTGVDAGPADAGCAGTYCDGICVDLQAEPDHCGRCNHACLGGGCAFGACQPYPIHAAVGAAPAQVVFDPSDDTVVWTDRRATGAVLARKADRSQATLTVAANQSYPEALAVDGLGIYWASLQELSGPRTGDVRWAAKPLDGTAQAASPASARNPRSVVAAAGFVYWSSDSPLHLRAYQLGSNPRVDLDYVPGVGSSFMRRLAADATHLYWADAGANVFRHPLSLPAGAPERVSDAVGGEASDLVVAGGVLYWAEDPSALQGMGRIFKATAGTGQLDVLVDHVDPGQLEHAAVGLEVADGFVYYVTAGPGGRGGSVFRAALADGTPERLASGGGATAALRDVAVGAGRVFWCEDDTVWGLALP